ncbi:MAG: phage major capsid protein [Brevundimonas sp.]|uniref:phage major capsid protein n=1 Tax=Brevundimonas sp. TaxID=1871086 RepID=UPI001202C7CE|nr:phage major capsid protein [Brevundimonas sp.]RZJ19117.1 MAG: phage major capsid protein [Brevundimonas sp.]
MSRIIELREKQAQLVAEARERLDQINANTDESRAAELETQHDAAMAEHDRIDKLIEREERMERVEQRANELREQRRPTPPDGQEQRGDDGKIEYRQVFAKVVCGVSPSDLTAEERQVLQKGVAEFRAQTAGTTTAGGYTVPTELLGEIEKAMKAWGPMYDSDICRVLTTSGGNPLKLPTVDDTGSTAEAHTENTALTDDGGKDVTFGQKSLDAYAFDTEFVRWSWLLEADSIFNMEALLGELLGERLARIANKQLTIGTGSSAPNGIVTASSLGVTAAATTAITFDELIDLEHSVDPAYRKAPGVGYMLNDQTFKAIRKLKDLEGRYIWQQGDVKGGAPGTLNGRPYHINQDMADIAAAAKAILFGDFKKYWVRKVGSPIIGVLRERFWPDLGIAGLIRFDGELAQAGAVKHLILKAS